MFVRQQVTAGTMHSFTGSPGMRALAGVAATWHMEGRSCWRPWATLLTLVKSLFGPVSAPLSGVNMQNHLDA
eukprot:843508-Pelagomonas_calceolata.AAC.1